MRSIVAAAWALMLVTASAHAADTGGSLAADTEGEVRQVDPDEMTITLDDGKTYKLPAEMDVSVIVEGITVIIAYDSRHGVNQITDMLIQ